MTSQATREQISRVLTEDRLQAITRMRRDLNKMYSELQDVEFHESFDNRSLGRLLERVEEAENDLFQICNTAKSFLNVDVPDDLMFLHSIEHPS